MTRREADARLTAARALLADEGLAGARAECAGHTQDILAVEGDASLAGRLRGLAPALKDLGFRYVALELAETLAPAPRET